MSCGITLARCGSAIEIIETETDELIIGARAVAKTAPGPAWGKAFGEQTQQLAAHSFGSALPGRAVQIRVCARLVRCRP
jgi:hypothetical protein